MPDKHDPYSDLHGESGSDLLEQLLPAETTATAITKHLDKYVRGQPEAKMQLSILLSMHLRWFKRPDPFHRSPNALLIGPTGVGKTHSIRMAADYLRLPYVLIDATSLVPSGIVGLQIEDILQDLVSLAASILSDHIPDPLRRPNDDIALARRGIIFIDEFDKLRGSDDSRLGEPMHQMVQRRLLKLSEGSVLGVGTRQHTQDIPLRTIDTAGILLIASGAFQGIDGSAIRAKRPQAIARTLPDPDQTISADVVSYGFIPELVARLPILIRFEPLTVDTLHDIVVDPEISPTRVWSNYFAEMGKVLTLSESAARWVAEQASTLNMGARGLQQILFPVLAEVAYRLETTSQTEIELTEDDFMRQGRTRRSSR